MKTKIILLVILLVTGCSQSNKSNHSIKNKKVDAIPIFEEKNYGLTARLVQINYRLYKMRSLEGSEQEQLQFLEKTIEINNTAIEELKEYWACPQLKTTTEFFPLFGKAFPYRVLSITDTSNIDRKTISDPTLNKIVYLAQTQQNNKILFDLLMSRSGTQGYFNGTENKLAFSVETVYWLFRGKDLSETMRHELTHGYFEQKRRQGEDSIYHLSFYRLDASESGKGGYEQAMSAEELYTFVNGPYWQNKFDPNQYDATDWTFYFQGIYGTIGGIKKVSEIVIKRAQTMKELLNLLTKDYLHYLHWNRYYIADSMDLNELYLINNNEGILMNYYLTPEDSFAQILRSAIYDYRLYTASDVSRFMSDAYDIAQLEQTTPQQDQLLETYLQLLQDQADLFLAMYLKLEKLSALATYYREEADRLMEALNNFYKNSESYWQILRSADYSEPQYSQAKNNMIKLFNDFKKQCRKFAMFSREETEEYNSIISTLPE